MPNMPHLDRLLPRHGFSEHHRIRVHASPEAAYAAIRELEMSDSVVARMVWPLWLLGARLLRKKVPDRHMSIDDFILLADDPPREMVRGLIGGQGQPYGVRHTPDEFAAFQGPGFKLAWSFAAAPLPDGMTLVETETRVLCCDAGTARWFRLYWLIIRPWSGLIRRDFLRAIRRRAEASSSS